MALQTHFITALKLSTATIDGIVDSRLSSGFQAAVIGHDSMALNDMAVHVQSQPSAAFSTTKIASAITAFSLTGLALSASPLEIYTIYSAQGGSRGTTGEKLAITKGIVVPGVISASQGVVPATMTWAVGAGGVAADVCPYTITSAQAAPTAVAATEEAFKMGPVTINSVDMPVTSWSIDFGYQLEWTFASGCLYPIAVYFTLSQPRITLNTEDATAFATVTTEGVATLLSLTLYKLQTGAAKAATGHKVFSTHRNMVYVADLGGSHNGRATTSIICEPVYDGTNQPVTVA